MSCCSAKTSLLIITIVQLFFTTQRQIIDFLGYMWAPILVNFFNIIFVIFGVFGAYQLRVKYILVYFVWSIFWIAWNVLVICIYLKVGVLDPECCGILDFNTGSRSWWESHGPGCRFNRSELHVELYGGPNPVVGCYANYTYIEAGQAALHAILAGWGIVIAAVTLYRISCGDGDSCSSKLSSKGLPPYSIEYRTHDPPHSSQGGSVRGPSMTPRRVKQRASSRRGAPPRYQNPVTRLMERSLSMSSQDSTRTATLFQGQSNPLYTRSTSVLYLNNGRPSPIYMNDADNVR